MTNRVPLIVNATTNRITELSATDNLELGGSSITTANVITSNTIITLNATLGNLATANYFTGAFKGYNEIVASGGNTGIGTIIPDVNVATIYKYTCTGDFTFNSIANVKAGTNMVIIFTQDSTGTRLMSSTMKFSGGANILSIDPDAVDIMAVFYDGTTYYASISQGYV